VEDKELAQMIADAIGESISSTGCLYGPDNLWSFGIDGDVNLMKVANILLTRIEIGYVAKGTTDAPTS
jgi:hypothetical protein